MSRPARSLKVFQSRAVDLLKAGNYGGALTAVDVAIEVAGRRNHGSGDSLLALLELKAIILEKAGRLKPALKVAQQMIVTQRHNAKGYLRYGKICLLQGDLQIALKAYTLGISKCKEVGQLVEMQAKTKRRIHLRHSCRDPVSCFPAEVLIMIFHYLGFRQLVVCQRVSRSWQNVMLSGIISRDMIMDFTNMGELRKATLQSALRLGPFNAIRWAEMRRNEEETCMRLLQNQEWIEHIVGGKIIVNPLEFYASTLDFKRLRSLRVTIGTVNLNKLLRNLPLLEVLDLTISAIILPTGSQDNSIAKHDALQALSLSHKDGASPLCRAGSTLGLCKLLSHYGNLCELTLKHICALEEPLIDTVFQGNLTRFHFYAGRSHSNSFPDPVVLRPSHHLEDLALHGIYDLRLPQRCEIPRLRSLKLSKCCIRSVTADHDQTIATLSDVIDHLGCGQMLRNLDLSESSFSIGNASDFGPNLEQVSFQKCYELRDAYIKKFALHHTALSEVNISGTQVGDTGLIALVNAGVRRLSLTDCPVTTETYHWLKEKGIDLFGN